MTAHADIAQGLGSAAAASGLADLTDLAHSLPLAS